MLYWLPALFALIAGLVFGPAAADTPAGKPDSAEKDTRLPKGVPTKVAKVLRHVDEYDAPPEGYRGGRHFGNFEDNLPKKDRRGRYIRYREWDVNPQVPGKNRGPERLVTGSDGSAFYTGDHYRTFKRIR